MSKEYIPAIDGMRAIAIGLVIAAHFGGERFVPGRFGVTLFFFVSGYLITGLLIQEHRATGKIAILSFYVRRFLRLAPALITMIFAVSVGYFLLFGSVSAGMVLAGLFYYMNYYEILGGHSNMPLWHLWSLAVEEHYYLVCPLVFAVTWKHRDQFLAGLVALTVAVLLWRFVLVSCWNVPEIRTAFATDTRIDSILYGAILAVMTKTRYALIVRHFEHWAVVATSSLLLMISFVYRDPLFRETLRYSLQGIAIVPLFYAVLFAPKFSPARIVLELPALIWIGKVSYSLYLYHIPIFFFVATLLPKASVVTLVSISLPAAVAVASFSYYRVEGYFQKFRGRFRPRIEDHSVQEVLVVKSKS